MFLSIFLISVYVDKRKKYTYNQVKKTFKNIAKNLQILNKKRRNLGLDFEHGFGRHLGLDLGGPGGGLEGSWGRLGASWAELGTSSGLP